MNPSSIWVAWAGRLPFAQSPPGQSVPYVRDPNLPNIARRFRSGRSCDQRQSVVPVWLSRRMDLLHAQPVPVSITTLGHKYITYSSNKCAVPVRIHSHGGLLGLFGRVFRRGARMDKHHGGYVQYIPYIIPLLHRLHIHICVHQHFTYKFTLPLPLFGAWGPPRQVSMAGWHMTPA